jgi:hypothetical protein
MNGGAPNFAGAPAPQYATKIRQMGGEEKQKRGQFFYNSKCHGCNKAPADNDNCNVSG